MKYYVVNRGDELSIRLTDTFHQLVKPYGLIVDEQTPDVVLSIGGDGTLLQAFHRFSSRIEQISFVGIHTGHLGFYADWQPEEIEKLAELMANHCERKETRIVKYPLIEMRITAGSSTEKYIALNEFTLKGADGTLVAGLHINDQLFEMFRGDGIVISTPSGSTAYNKSLGGALIHPSLETIQIAEIASINNRVYRTLGSSIILPKHHHCDIYPREGQNIMIAIDHLTYLRGDIDSIRFRVADTKVSFARYRPFPFWTRVKEAFIGDIE